MILWESPYDEEACADSETAMGKRLSDTEQRVFAKALRRSVDIVDDPVLAEIKRMEAMMGKAPCLARLDELAAWSAKDAD